MSETFKDNLVKLAKRFNFNVPKYIKEHKEEKAIVQKDVSAFVKQEAIKIAKDELTELGLEVLSVNADIIIDKTFKTESGIKIIESGTAKITSTVRFPGRTKNEQIKFEIKFDKDDWYYPSEFEFNGYPLTGTDLKNTVDNMKDNLEKKLK